MKFLAVIPARYASTRFPGKPLADIHGKTMIQHVYERVSEIFDYCYVATDDARIESVVRKFGGNVVMTSTSHKSGTDRCREALDKIETAKGFSFDVVVNVQGDEPFVSQNQLVSIKELFGDSVTDIATLVKLFSAEEDIFNPNTPKVVLSGDYFALYFSRSVIPYLRSCEDKIQWQSNYQYYKHIGLYAYRSDILRQLTVLPQSPLEIAESLEQLRWLENGYRIKVAVTDTESHAVDTPEDLEFVLKNYSL